MKKIKGNIWNYHKNNAYIIIPTNLGWTKENKNVMGRGIAKQASLKFPVLPFDYGKTLKENYINNINSNIILFHDLKVICFATKPLNKTDPHLSWKQNSSIEQIINSCYDLKEYIQENNFNNQIFIPKVGCGNGCLNFSDIETILEDILGNLENITLIT